MRCDEVPSTDDRSQGGDDGKSVSTLDIADVASHCESPGDSHGPASNPSGAQEQQVLQEKNQRPKSATSQQVEDPDENAALGRRLNIFQYNMKFCSFAILVVSLIFIVIVVTLSFSLPKPLLPNSRLQPSNSTPMKNISHF